jgi:hypothetical protein
VAELTRALIANHGRGRGEAFGPALLDVAQDHLLYLLLAAGSFDGDELIFKGGTSLRKCRIGGNGRFSTDIDFAAPSEDVVLEVCGRIDGAVVGGFNYRLGTSSDDGRHWDLTIEHEEFGPVQAASSVEFARRPLVRPPERLEFVRLQVHQAYGFDLPALPVIAEAEACAEKLARYRRVPYARDLYDLAWFAGRHLDEPLIRRLWILKLWGDIIDDRRGEGPVSPNDVLAPRKVSDFKPVPIGSLTQPVAIEEWEQRVRSRFTFLADLDDDERRWAMCDHRHRDEIDAAIAALRA